MLGEVLGAQLAGLLGLPFSFAHHFDTGGTLRALELYRQAFEPSPILDRPHAIVTANVLTAETDEHAAFLAAPGQLMMHAIRTGRFTPLCSPEEAAVHPDLPAARAMPTNRVIGSPATVVAALDALVEAAGADELMVSSVAHGLDERVRSLELLAEAWPIHAPDGPASAAGRAPASARA